MFLVKRIKQSRGRETGWTNERASGWQTNDTKKKGNKNGRCQFVLSDSIPRRNNKKKRENGKKERRDPVSPPLEEQRFFCPSASRQAEEWGSALVDTP